MENALSIKKSNLTNAALTVGTQLRLRLDGTEVCVSNMEAYHCHMHIEIKAHPKATNWWQSLAACCLRFRITRQVAMAERTLVSINGCSHSGWDRSGLSSFPHIAAREPTVSHFYLAQLLIDPSNQAHMSVQDMLSCLLDPFFFTSLSSARKVHKVAGPWQPLCQSPTACFCTSVQLQFCAKHQLQQNNLCSRRFQKTHAHAFL